MEWTEAEDRVIKGIEGLEKLVGQVEGQEKLVQGFKTEIGTARKEIREAMEGLDKAKSGDMSDEDKARLKKVLDASDKIDQVIRRLDDPSLSRNRPEGFEALQAKLPLEQRRVANEAFRALPPEEREAVKKDPEKAAALLKAIGIEAPTESDSLFDESEASEPYEQRLARLLKTGSGVRNHVPGSRSSAGSVAGGGAPTDELPTSRRLPNGEIPRPAAQ